MKITKSYLKQIIKEELQMAERAAAPAAKPQVAAKPQAAGVTSAQTGGLPQEILTALAGPGLWQLLENLKSQLYNQLGSKVGQFIVDNWDMVSEVAITAAEAAGMAEQNVVTPKPLPGGRINLRTNRAALDAVKAAARQGIAAAKAKGIKIGKPR